MKLAQKENLGKDSLAYRVGFILVGLMIANVVLSTVERLFPSLPSVVTIGTEAALLIARAVMCVIYGYAVHSLRGDEPASADLVKADDVHSRLDAFNARFQEQGGQVDTLSKKVDTLAGNITPLSRELDTLSTSLDTLTTSLSTVLSTFESHLTRLDSQLVEVGQGQGQNFHELEQSLRTVVIEVREATMREITPLIAQARTAHQEMKQPRLIDSQVDTQGQDRGRKIMSLSSSLPVDTRNRQAEVVSDIRDFLERERREPTLSEIMNATGCAKQTAVNSRNSVRETVSLEDESQAAP